jgi:hypothetical protein
MPNEDNVIQVRFQAVDQPERGIFRVMCASEVDATFTGKFPGWVDKGVEALVIADVFQILIHHWVQPSGLVEAWYVTVHPAF